MSFWEMLIYIGWYWWASSTSGRKGILDWNKPRKEERADALAPVIPI